MLSLNKTTKRKIALVEVAHKHDVIKKRKLQFVDHKNDSWITKETCRTNFKCESAETFYGTGSTVNYGGHQMPCDIDYHKWRLEILNPFPTDYLIRFRPSDHVYFIDGIKQKGSTTSFTGQFIKPFEELKVATGMVNNLSGWKKHCRNTPHYAECDVPGNKDATVQNILKCWEDNRDLAADKGTYNHEQVERFYNCVPYDSSGRSNFLFRQFHQEYVVKNNLIPFRTEANVHTKRSKDEPDMYQLRGQVDMIYQCDPNDPKKIVVFDWKFSKELIKKYKKKMNGNPKYRDRCAAPFNNMWDTKLAGYILQLNIYCMILEKFYGFEVVSLHLGVFHEDQTQYLVVDIPFVRDELSYVFETRRASIEENTKANKVVNDINDITYDTWPEGPDIVPEWHWGTENTVPPRNTVTPIVSNISSPPPKVIPTPNNHKDRNNNNHLFVQKQQDSQKTKTVFTFGGK